MPLCNGLRLVVPAGLTGGVRESAGDCGPMSNIGAPREAMPPSGRRVDPSCEES